MQRLEHSYQDYASAHDADPLRDGALAGAYEHCVLLIITVAASTPSDDDPIYSAAGTFTIAEFPPAQRSQISNVDTQALTAFEPRYSMEAV